MFWDKLCNESCKASQAREIQYAACRPLQTSMQKSGARLKSCAGQSLNLILGPPPTRQPCRTLAFSPHFGFTPGLHLTASAGCSQPAASARGSHIDESALVDLPSFRDLSENRGTLCWGFLRIRITMDRILSCSIHPSQSRKAFGPDQSPLSYVGLGGGGGQTRKPGITVP